jgi:hypothetical protein
VEISGGRDEKDSGNHGGRVHLGNRPVIANVMRRRHTSHYKTKPPPLRPIIMNEERQFVIPKASTETLVTSLHSSYPLQQRHAMATDVLKDVQKVQQDAAIEYSGKG